jgi:hypothetical protein
MKLKWEQVKNFYGKSKKLKTSGKSHKIFMLAHKSTHRTRSSMQKSVDIKFFRLHLWNMIICIHALKHHTYFMCKNFHDLGAREWNRQYKRNMRCERCYTTKQCFSQISTRKQFFHPRSSLLELFSYDFLRHNKKIQNWNSSKVSCKFSKHILRIDSFVKHVSFQPSASLVAIFFIAKLSSYMKLRTIFSENNSCDIEIVKKRFS